MTPRGSKATGGPVSTGHVPVQRRRGYARWVARLAFALLVATLALAASAAGAPPDDLTDDPRERGALLALPSVYRLTTEVTAEALVTEDGRRVSLPPGARRLGEVGTAVGVAPNGHLVSAAHVATPFGESLAVSARIAQLAVTGRPHSEAVARGWVRATGARAEGVRIVRRTIDQADAGAGADGLRAWTPTVVRSDRAADLAVLRIPAPGAPALDLDGSRTNGTPIATIGYGPSSEPRGPLEPAVRVGELGRTGTAKSRPGRRLLEVTTGVEQGDSGGPAVDAEGRVHGIVVLRSAEGGIVEPASAVRALLSDAGLSPATTPSADAFSSGMGRFWALDFDGAERDLAAAAAAFPAHTLAERQRARAAELGGAAVELGPDRARIRWFLLAFGVLAAAIAAGFAIGLGTIGWNDLVRRERQRSG